MVTFINAIHCLSGSTGPWHHLFIHSPDLPGDFLGKAAPGGGAFFLFHQPQKGNPGGIPGVRGVGVPIDSCIIFAKE